MSHRRFAAVVTILLLAGGLSKAPPAGGQAPDPSLPDAQPTWWHEAAGLTPLLTAPPPPNPATICIIDTGVTPTPDLDITARWAYDGGTLDDVHATEDTPGHGTLVAHFAAAKVNGWGGAGAFPHARISSVRVFPREGGAAWQDYIRAITRCVKLDPNTKVIVISLGGQTIDPGEADELEHWVERARARHGLNVIASAGNGAGNADFPGRFKSAFTVAATNHRGELCDFSARGEDVDIGAPGCGLPQVAPSGWWWEVSGTSFAAPLVAGAVAAIRSYAPWLSASEAETTFLRGARAGVPPGLDARAALSEVAALPRVNRESGAEPSRPAGITTAGQAPDCSPTVLPTPSVTVRRTARGVLLIARNRPAGATLQARTRYHATRAPFGRLRLPAGVHRIRCRFIRACEKSRWTLVRW